MTFVPSFQFDNVEIVLAVDPPYIHTELPAEGSADIAVGTTISFIVEDPNGDIDISTLNTSIEDDLGNSVDMVLSNVAQPGYSLFTTPVTNGHQVIITPDDDLKAFTIYTVTAQISDTQPLQATKIWSFDTEDGPVDGPTLVASPLTGAIRVSWSVVEGMRADEFIVRRSDVTPPTWVDEGDPFYQGTDLNALDTDVEYDVTYYYSVFVIRRYESGTPNYYTPYDSRASDSAKLVTRILPTIRGVEYVPVAGELGTVVDPFSGSRLVSGFGDGTGTRSEGDLYDVPAGQAIRCPVTCTVSKVRNNAVNDLNSSIELDTDKFIFIVDGLVLANGVEEGAELVVGELLGRSTGQDVFFQIFRKATDTQGKRVVRPSRFFVRTEDRQ